MEHMLHTTANRNEIRDDEANAVYIPSLYTASVLLVYTIMER